METRRSPLSDAVARQALAAMCSALFLAALQLSVFAAVKTVDIISYRNLTGGLDFISAVLMACCFAAAAALSYVLMGGVFSLIAFKVRLPAWLPPLLVFFGSAAAAFSLGWATHRHFSLKLLALAGLLSGVFSLGFAVYWLAARWSGPLISWLRDNPPSN